MTHLRPAVEHYSTHSSLLRPSRPGRAEPDVIVVPAARPASNLDSAIRLGAALGVEVVVLCSRQARTDEVLRTAAEVDGARCTVVDFPAAVPAVPQFDTSLFGEAAISWHGDVSLKRNAALVLGRMLGWSTALFLDDDIRDLGPTQVREAVGTLRVHAAAGMASTSYPDNSAVCHARRLAVGDQGVFVGAHALAVNLDRIDSFFPQIYNEDWLLLAPFFERGEVAAAGAVRQKMRDPYTPETRVAEEEFGDVVGEGIIGQLHVGPLESTRSPDFWARFLELRAEFIRTTSDACQRSDHPDAERALDALRTAEAARSRLRPEMLADYVTSWYADLDTWRRYLSQVARRDDLPSALAAIGLSAESVGPRPARNTRP